MPTVACPSCTKPVALPDPPTASVYSCPHCRGHVPAPAPRRAPAPPPAPKPAAFEFEPDDGADEPAPRSRTASRRASHGTPGGPSWLTIFTATLAANVLAGAIILFGVRLYIYWSIADTVDKLNNSPTKVVK